MCGSLFELSEFETLFIKYACLIITALPAQQTFEELNDKMVVKIKLFQPGTTAHDDLNLFKHLEFQEVPCMRLTLF